MSRPCTAALCASALAALLAFSLPAAAEGDAENGAKVFRTCAACHTVDKGQPHRVGPNLHGLFGRTSGSAEGFRYSPAMKDAGVVWSADTLKQYLANPRSFVPGNRMPFAGLPKEQDREDLIAYLEQATQ